MALPQRNTAPPWFQALLNSGDPKLVNPTPPPTPPPPPGGPVSGGDMADIFAPIIAQQNAADQARTGFKRDLFFGRHLGTGGGEITPNNPAGNPANPWDQGGAFVGNPTHRAAEAIQQRPLWSAGQGGQYVHGTNYPGAPLPRTPGTPSDTLPTMTPEEQASVLRNYSPQPDVFAQRGLDLTPLGQRLRQPFIPPQQQQLALQ